MDYLNLADLLRGSASSREFFYTLPPDLQISMQPYADLVHNAEELHRAVNAAQLRRKMSENAGDNELYL